MEMSSSITKIAPAFLKAQAAMNAAAKTASNPHFKSKYADLSTIIAEVKPALNFHGISFLQSSHNDATGVTVSTVFLHDSGEWLRATIYLPVPQQTPQAYGSAITYGKRYQLQSMTGLPSEDDDGQAASAPRPNTATQVAVDAFDALPADEQKFLMDHVTVILDKHKSGDDDLYKYIDLQHFDTEEKLALWSRLPSNVRTAIKKQQPAQLATQG